MKTPTSKTKMLDNSTPQNYNPRSISSNRPLKVSTVALIASRFKMSTSSGKPEENRAARILDPV